MARSVAEWIGKTDDTPIPDRVKVRVRERFNGRCAKCGRDLRAGHWDADHRQAIINGGENREGNLQPLCDDPCHPAKTKTDVAEKSATYHTKLKHYGVRRARQPIQGWRKFDGTPVRNPKLQRGRR